MNLLKNKLKYISLKCKIKKKVNFKKEIYIINELKRIGLNE